MMGATAYPYWPSLMLLTRRKAEDRQVPGRAHRLFWPLDMPAFYPDILAAQIRSWVFVGPLRSHGLYSVVNWKQIHSRCS